MLEAIDGYDACPHLKLLSAKVYLPGGLLHCLSCRFTNSPPPTHVFFLFSSGFLVQAPDE